MFPVEAARQPHLIVPPPEPVEGYEELVRAISDRDLRTVQRILAQRDAWGNPHAAVNGGPDNRMTVLMHAITTRPLHEGIIATLLEARNHAGNPVIDLNQLGPHDQTIFSFILDIPDARVRREILQRVLDVRGPQGELLADLRSDEANIPLLKQALSKNDLHCLRILLDARLADGNFALDVNEIRHGTTLLDAALETNNSWYHYNPEIVAAIRAAGGRTFADILAAERPHHQREAPPPAPPAPVVVQAAPQPQPAPVVVQAAPPPPPQNVALANIAQFNQNAQNTHDAAVTQTAKSSILALNRRYPVNLAEEGNFLQDIEELIEHFDYTRLTIDPLLSASQKKQLALKFLGIIRNRLAALHSHTDLTIRRILYLVWKGINDPRIEVCPEEIRSTLPPGLQTIPPSFIALRRESFVERFIEAARTYPDGVMDICVGGSVHKVVEILNLGHVDVFIATGAEAANSAANDLPASLAKKASKEKNPREQRAILRDWDNDQGAAAQFRESLKELVPTELRRIFAHLISEQRIDEIVGALDYLPKPVLYPKLDELLELIRKIAPRAEGAAGAEELTSLRERARHVYDENDLPLEQEFGSLHTQLIQFLGALPPEEMTEDFIGQVRSIQAHERIEALPSSLIRHLSANQIKHLTPEQIPHLVNQQVRHVSRWNFVHLTQLQLQQRSDLGTYIAIEATAGAVTALISLIVYFLTYITAALPLIKRFNRVEGEKYEQALVSHPQRFVHLWTNVIPAAAG